MQLCSMSSCRSSWRRRWGAGPGGAPGRCAAPGWRHATRALSTGCPGHALRTLGRWNSAHAPAEPSPPARTRPADARAAEQRRARCRRRRAWRRARGRHMGGAQPAHARPCGRSGGSHKGHVPRHLAGGWLPASPPSPMHGAAPRRSCGLHAPGRRCTAPVAACQGRSRPRRRPHRTSASSSASSASNSLNCCGAARSTAMPLRSVGAALRRACGAPRRLWREGARRSARYTAWALAQAAAAGSPGGGGTG
jgi:hypothetical protein